MYHWNYRNWPRWPAEWHLRQQSCYRRVIFGHVPTKAHECISTTKADLLFGVRELLPLKLSQVTLLKACAATCHPRLCHKLRKDLPKTTAKFHSSFARKYHPRSLQTTVQPLLHENIKIFTDKTAFQREILRSQGPSITSPDYKSSTASKAHLKQQAFYSIIPTG